MRYRQRQFCELCIFLMLLGGIILPAAAHAEPPKTWPPDLKGAENGTVTLETKRFLEVPESVKETRGESGVASFVVAETPPKVELAYHRDLGPGAIERRLWSSWGDICVASDGRVYCGIGDHGDDAGGDARCFLYRWDPEERKLEQIIDMNNIIPPRAGQPAWSKVHARIDEGSDGAIYFSCTLNAGSRAGQEQFHWNEKLPGGQLYRYDPATGETSVFASLPPERCTATSILDRRHDVWWCVLEAGEGDALWGLDLKTKEPVFRSSDGTVKFNRNFALARDGSIYFNGERGIWQYDPASNKLAATGLSFPGSPGMRSSTRQAEGGWIYGTTHGADQLFRFHPEKKELKLLGPTWRTGEYTTVTILSPDEKYVYYLPGSHGKAFQYGTPVVQYEIATGRRKVLAFLAAPFEKEYDYVPGGTYGAKLSADGSALYVNFNGHASDDIRPEKMRPIGFGLCAFAAIHIPESER